MRKCNITLVAYFCICIIALSSCHNAKELAPSSAKIDGDILTVTTDTMAQYNLEVSIDQIKCFKTIIKGEAHFNIIDSLKYDSSIHYHTAYTLAKNRGLINAHIVIPHKLDTIVQLPLICQNNNLSTENSYIISGKHSKIINALDRQSIEDDLKRWVYKNKKTSVGCTLLDSMRLYLKALNYGPNVPLAAKGNIPLVKESQFRNIRYQISSSMIADYYYLFACTNDKAIDLFIEDMIIQNMPNANKSISEPFYCHKQNHSSGAMCIFLVGINKDWSSCTTPLGIISIDGAAPSYRPFGGFHNSHTEVLNFMKRGFVIDVSSQPDVFGNWQVEFGQFEGCEVPYTLTWNGDVDKIIIYNNVYENGESVTINLPNKTSPYHITIDTYLNIGDNYIKLKAIDKFGHIDTEELQITTVSLDRGIHIENNIWN